MKGVILAGGSGTRLFPNTKVTNKHLLPVYNKPMIYYAIETLIRAGITEILILPSKDHAGAFTQLLGSGSEFNATFTYRVQESASGLAYAVGLAEPFVGKDNFMVIFGDNIIFDDLSEHVRTFEGGAKVFLKQVPDPNRHGIAELNGTKVKHIEEKPVNPKSDWAAVGVYLYDDKAFDYIKELKPSARGELEITDLNNRYIQESRMEAGFLEEPWFDAGTHESLVEAAASIRDMRRPVERIKVSSSLSPNVTAGIVLRDSLAHLPRFLESLHTQDYRNISLLAFDLNENPKNADVSFIRQKYPEITIVRSETPISFTKAHNHLIRNAKKAGADFYLTLHTELTLEQNFVSELVNVLIKNPKNASASGKLRLWNTAEGSPHHGGASEGKTNFLDSTGLLVTREHRFVSRGEGEIDHGQYDNEGEVFGVPGTAALYRMSALQDVAFRNEQGGEEFFDELMLMYKEDVDLAYRFQLAGYRALYTPNAVAYHTKPAAAIAGRGILSTVMRRRSRKRVYKEWSWINHHIMLSKYFDRRFSSTVIRATLWYELKTLLYMIVLEPYLLPQLLRWTKLHSKIVQRREQVKRRIPDYRPIERWMV